MQFRINDHLLPAGHPLRGLRINLSMVFAMFAVLAVTALALYSPEAMAGIKELGNIDDVEKDTTATLKKYWKFGANIVAFLFAAGLLISIIFAGGRGWWIFLLGALAAAFGDDIIMAIIEAGSTS